MSKRIRLKPEDRRAKILESSIEIFNKKGYKETTMADLVEASDLSFGGFYHYYSDKADVLMDIMREGNRYRLEENRRFLKEHPNLGKEEILIEMGINKLLDKNTMKPIYSMLLMEVKSDEKIRKLYNELIKEGMEDFRDFLGKSHIDILSDMKSEFFLGVINSLFLGIYALDLEDIFSQDREALKDIIKTMLKHIKNKGEVYEK